MDTVTTTTPARQRLLDAVARLFYAEGMVATGIDTITAEAGVARKRLYNNFASKQDLMLAYIRGRHEEWLELFQDRLDRAGSPRERVLAVFDAYLDHAEAAYAHGFRGGGLLNAAEFRAGSAGREAVREHKEQVEAILTDHLTEAGCADPAGTAEHFSFLLEGAMSRAGLEGRSDRLLRARRIAETLLDAR